MILIELIVEKYNLRVDFRNKTNFNSPEEFFVKRIIFVSRRDANRIRILVH
jgi:hypothetical protein